jgi:signal-transduction protein with cAMP-binding, CBS, and nucleotidyltransferase domain
VHPEPAELAAIPLFEGLQESELATLATHFDVEEFDPGHSPAKFGQHGYAFFVLAGGVARVEVDGVVVEHLEPGAIFGEMALFEPNSRRTATVIPETTIRVFSLFGADFRVMQHDFPVVAERVEASYNLRHARDEARAAELS